MPRKYLITENEFESIHVEGRDLVATRDNGTPVNFGQVVPDISPEMQQLLDDTEAARDQAEVFAAGTVALQDAAVAQAISTPGSETQTQLNATIGSLTPLPGRVLGTPPAGEFGWLDDYGMVPEITVARDGTVRGSVGVTPEELFSQQSTALAAPGKEYFVNVGGARTVDGVEWSEGSNTNDGLSEAAPVQSIHVALTKARDDAPAGGARINVLAGDYGQDYGISDAAGAHPLGSLVTDTALVAVGGRVVDSRKIATVGVPERHGTYENTYQVSANTARLVLDKTTVDSRGVPRRYRVVASGEECNTSPGTVFYGSTSLLIHPYPGVGPIRDWNTEVFLQPDRIVKGEINFYMGGRTPDDGWDIIGGVRNLSFSPPSALSVRKLAVMSKVRGIHTSTSAGGYSDGSFTIRPNWCGLAAFFDCQAIAPDVDGFNLHTGAVNASRLVTVNCGAYDVGQDEDDNETSCNAWTLHEDAEGVDVAGEYFGSHGATIHNIQTSKAYMLGTTSADDYGDVDRGGGIDPTQYRVSAGSPKLWLERCMAGGVDGGVAYSCDDALGGVGIYLKNPYPTQLVAEGDIGSF